MKAYVNTTNIKIRPLRLFQFVVKYMQLFSGTSQLEMFSKDKWLSNAMVHTDS